MPLLIFVLLIILIATFGFWDTFQAILGAVGVLLLLGLLLIALVAAIVGWLLARARRNSIRR